MSVKFRKKMSIIIASTIIFLLSANTYVYADNKPFDYDGGKSAYLKYDKNIGDYRIYADEGGEIEFEAEENTESETDITAETDNTEVPAVTTVTSSKSVIVYITTTTTKAVSPAKNVPEYSGRHREDALSERSSYLNAYTTTTTRITTTVTTTKKVYNGIDVSRHQGNIDWKKVKAAGIEFVMIRAGYGMEDDQVDLKFHENIKAAQAVGIDCGVYWYSYAVNTSEALREAKLCQKTIKNYKLTYPVAFDIEDPSQSHLTMTEISNITKTFCDYLEGQKYFVAVYSYASMLNSKMNSSVLSKYDIWVAHTGVSKPNFSGKYGMWQYSWKGSVSGISTDVDLDYSYKYYPELIKKNKLNGY